MARISGIAIVAIVALRLVTGWHFFNEGVKKLDPSFTSAGFLRTAKGPLVPVFRAMAPGPHDAYAILGEPKAYGTGDPEVTKAVNAWRADYGKRASDAIKAGEPLPTDMNPNAPGAEWLANVRASWEAGLERLGRLGVTDEQAQELSAWRDEQLGQVVDYLHTEGPAIEELQHEASRLETQKAASGNDSPPPYQLDRIAAKDAEVWKTMQPWVANVTQIENDFIDGAVAIVSGEGPSESRVRAALAERSLLGWIDLAVAAVVLGSGICLFLGLGTRVAALLAGGFLLSLIATQPPWVAGADTSAFFAWMVELFAFFVIAAVGAGQWAGLDGVFHQMRLRVGDLAPKNAPPPAAPAKAA